MTKLIDQMILWTFFFFFFGYILLDNFKNNCEIVIFFPSEVFTLHFFFFQNLLQVAWFALLTLHPGYPFHSLQSLKFSSLSLNFFNLLEELCCKPTSKHEIKRSSLEFLQCHFHCQSPQISGIINSSVGSLLVNQEILCISQPAPDNPAAGKDVCELTDP